MSKRWLAFVLAVFCFSISGSCFAVNQNEKINLERESPGQWYGDVNLLGPVNRKGFTSSPYSKWFLSGYQDYQPDRQIIRKIKSSIENDPGNIEITLFMGTWCGDSKKQTPRLYKILDSIGFDEGKLTAYALDIVPDKFRKTPGGIAEKGKNIYRVPTIIFEKQGNELGRIVESPLSSLESDVLDILTGTPLNKSPLHLEGEVNYYLQDHGVAYMERNIDAMANEFRDKGIRENELNQYIAYNLIYSHRYREAVLVTRMMIKIFPASPHLHLVLAKIYDLMGNDRLALSSYREAFNYGVEEDRMSIFRKAIERSQQSDR